MHGSCRYDLADRSLGAAGLRAWWAVPREAEFAKQGQGESGVSREQRYVWNREKFDLVGVKASFSKQLASSVLIVWNVYGAVLITCFLFKNKHKNKSELFFSQGAGTAIGELPPYFMARAARLSGAEPDDEEYQEFEEMLEHAETAQVRTVQNNRINKTQNN